MIRDVAHMLSLEGEQNVVIIDTSNEIAGDGVCTHESVGMARRMMVKKPEDQFNVMLECVQVSSLARCQLHCHHTLPADHALILQNHTPDVVIIDEISRDKEVKAAKSIQSRGVRLIASAHGNDLGDLMSNTELHGLLGSRQATIAAGGVSQLNVTGQPVFDIIVMLPELHSWLVCFDVHQAHKVLCSHKETYQLQRRTRNPNTGMVTVDEFSKAYNDDGVIWTGHECAEAEGGRQVTWNVSATAQG